MILWPSLNKYSRLYSYTGCLVFKCLVNHYDLTQLLTVSSRVSIYLGEVHPQWVDVNGFKGS